MQGSEETQRSSAVREGAAAAGDDPMLGPQGVNSQDRGYNLTGERAARIWFLFDDTYSHKGQFRVKLSPPVFKGTLLIANHLHFKDDFMRIAKSASTSRRTFFTGGMFQLGIANSPGVILRTWGTA